MTSIVSVYAQVIGAHHRGSNSFNLVLSNPEGIFNVRAAECQRLREQVKTEEFLHIGGELFAFKNGQVAYINPISVYSDLPDPTRHLTTVLTVLMAGGQRCLTCAWQDKCKTKG